jgi:hypothetical protein
MSRVERLVINHIRWGFSPFLQEALIVYGVQRIDGVLLFVHLLHSKLAKMH